MNSTVQNSDNLRAPELRPRRCRTAGKSGFKEHWERDPWCWAWTSWRPCPHCLLIGSALRRARHSRVHSRPSGFKKCSSLPSCFTFHCNVTLKLGFIHIVLPDSSARGVCVLLCGRESQCALVWLPGSEPEASAIPGALTITWYKTFRLKMKLLLGEFSPKAKKKKKRHKNSSPPLCMPHYTETEDSMFGKLSFL